MNVTYLGMKKAISYATFSLCHSNFEPGAHAEASNERRSQLLIRGKIRLATKQRENLTGSYTEVNPQLASASSEKRLFVYPELR